MRAICTILLFSLAALPVSAQESPYGKYENFVPDSAFTTTADGTPPAAELVARLFALSFAEQCSWGLSGDPEMLTPKTYDLSYRYDFDAADTPDRSLRIYRLFCGSGAYNLQHVYMSWTADDGIRVLNFAQPTFVATQADPDNPDSALTGITLTGQSATSVLINSVVDPKTGTISSQSCWRGLCDASSIGIWVLDGPEYRLQRFLVDPTYDGEMNHIELINYEQPQPVPLKIVPTPEVPMPEDF